MESTTNEEGSGAVGGTNTISGVGTQPQNPTETAVSDKHIIGGEGTAAPPVVVATTTTATAMTSTVSTESSIGDSTVSTEAAADENAFGRHKPPPVANPLMLKDSMATATIRKLAFPVASNDSTPPSITSGVLQPFLTSTEQTELNTLISSNGAKGSRQGREGQRWLTEPGTGERIRLVTGCIPILRDGRILLVQSSRKNEWILPKGGWEKDESLQLSASRETFEEAGALGTLGPVLTEIKYETRKSKKRKLENRSNAASPASPASAKNGVSTKATPALSATTAAATPSQTSQKTYTFVLMKMLVLYVTDVRDDWPESKRLRRAAPIDEALKILEPRPEFRQLLEEVRAKSLHLVDAVPTTSDTAVTPTLTPTPQPNGVKPPSTMDKAT